ncbi:hypothetical protein LV478_04440 [Komagataeibacter oboediens]|uniref:hypothetical protein n=1 Tax=Komagataeibacter oboediens TaxID=65958 RepID=UPI00190583DF|nr:hypothetical protein [Komagataeibacter oboediens]MBV1824348.1 hypothetical protein [Komagataeibacter oboediens]WEQ52799.1 hypothetical protein LV478_04440 [Komagataeibacter oboediens]GCE80523.1 hypothetical protein MSKU3_1998 [Komagataeibacter oboediens]
MTFVVKESKKEARVAVLMYGFLRDYAKTAASFKKVILASQECSLFFFGPDYTDAPDKNFGVGRRDDAGFFIDNPKSKLSKYVKVKKDDFLKTYKDWLVDYQFHSTPQSSFIQQRELLVPETEWLFRLDPARILSMFYNMGGVIDNFFKYTETTGERYDVVLITRSDLAFYNNFSAEVGENEIHIPLGEGFDNNGCKPLGNAPVYYYKNMNTGEYIPGDRTKSFNDQVIVLSYKSAYHLRNLYNKVKACLGRKVPPSPETILYLLSTDANFKVITHPEWNYEIYRAGKKPIENVLSTPDLSKIDPYHPILKKASDLDLAMPDFKVAAPFANAFPNLKPISTTIAPVPGNFSGEFVGLQFDQLSPRLQRILNFQARFMKPNLINKMKHKTDLFFRDAYNPLTKAIKYLYVMESTNKNRNN